jgi:DNA polymerase-4
MGPRQIVHVDMDAFYASVEQRDDPSLRGKPIIVGGPSKRGVVCTASYEARPFGVRSAMPMGEALRRCPQAIVVTPRMGHYGEVSRSVMEILHRFTPLVEPLSLDEAFLDVTASQSLFGDGPTIATSIRDAIRSELSLTASAGVAPSKFVAKIASDLHKPDGLTVVGAGEEVSFLTPLPLERMWGIGPKTSKKLRGAGFATIGDLTKGSPGELRRLMGNDWADVVVDLARGLDTRDVIPDRGAVSMGAEETFETDLVKRKDIERSLLGQAERVAQRLAMTDQVARCVQLKVKRADFTLVTRRVTLPDYVSDTTSIHRAACALLDKVDLEGARFRLTGVSVSNIVATDDVPRALFPDRAVEKRALLERVALSASERFGKGALVHADTLSSPSRRHDP